MAAKAASAAALEEDDSEVQRRLEGTRFRVRIRFGCATQPHPAPGVAPFNVRFDKEKRTLRIHAAPDLTLGDAQIAQLAGQQIEAVEGFWLRRPWLLKDGCPAARSSAPLDTPVAVRSPKEVAQGQLPEMRELLQGTGQRVGLAQFFAEGDSRVGRRTDRAYEVTTVLAETEQPSRDGYNLVLEGRLRILRDGRVVSCRVTSTDAPPECVVSAKFDRVWIEQPDTKEIVAEWSP